MEIASWFNVGHATIERRIADETLHDHDGEKLTFKAIMDRGYARGRITLRRKQMQLAEAGNARCWCGSVSNSSGNAMLLIRPGERLAAGRLLRSKSCGWRCAANSRRRRNGLTDWRPN